MHHTSPKKKMMCLDRYWKHASEEIYKTAVVHTYDMIYMIYTVVGVQSHPALRVQQIL